MSFNLNRNPIGDVEALWRLTSLRSLRLDGVEVGLGENSTALEYLVRLKVLSLGESGLRNINGLRKLVELEELNLRVNEVSDIRPLAGLKKLRQLDLSSNYIRDLRPLAGFAQLETLNPSFSTGRHF